MALSECLFFFVSAYHGQCRGRPPGPPLIDSSQKLKRRGTSLQHLLAVALNLNLTSTIKKDLWQVLKLPALLICLPTSLTMHLPHWVVNPLGWVVNPLGVSICLSNFSVESVVHISVISLPFLTMHLPKGVANPFGWVVNPLGLSICLPNFFC